MNDRQRFDELWTDLLEGDLPPEGMQELQELLRNRQWLAQAADQYQLHRLLGLQSLDEEERDFVEATMDALPVGQEEFVSNVEDVILKLDFEDVSGHKSDQVSIQPNGARFPSMVVVASVFLLLGCFLYFNWSSASPQVEIIELRGQVTLTGDGGKIVDNLDVGHRFHGGTLESLAPDSFCTLRFDDQTTITISGHTFVSISQESHKRVRLRRGCLSAKVTPQPKGQPMLVATEAAELTVLGTEFNVEAKPESTNLVVNKGLVRVQRLSDGKPVEVPARQSVIVSVGGQDGFSPAQREAPVTIWRSDLQKDVVMGKWVSHLWSLGMRLKVAVAKGEMTKEAAKRVFKSKADFGDSSGSVFAMPTKIGSLIILSPERSAKQPVWLNSNTVIRVKGRIYERVPLKIGLSVGFPAGGFAGKFSTQVSSDDFAIGKDFSVELPIGNFKDELNPNNSLVGNELTDWWCVTKGKSSKFEITSVEVSDTPKKETP